ncbi:MAG: hypothetical protein WAT27_09960 [Chitinophagales bacterium]
MKFSVALFSLLLLYNFNITAQSPFEYAVHIDSIQIPGLPGLHSYAFAEHDGKWLIIGGRTDGLHPRQPFASFPEADNNTDVYVIDIENKQFWSSSLNVLPTAIKEQLQSSNMNFYQDADTLVLIGGYCYAQSAATHKTFPNLTTVNVSGLINAIITNTDITPFFKQITDDKFAVTGGELAKLSNQFYLVGGQRFDGQYNPMGHGTYVQTYTEAIQKFTLNNSGATLSYSGYEKITDPIHLHRRDYNLLSHIFPDGSEGLVISSGVFQPFVDLPFLYPVEIKEDSYVAKTEFNQYLNNYHTAHTNIYDSLENKMTSLFFGGISQYYYVDGALHQDDFVPFVNTISGISRDNSGNLTEFYIPTGMPGYKGSSAEFLPNYNLTYNHSEILRETQFEGDTITIGYILGGISSPSKNPFSMNQTSLTSADNNIYIVKLYRAEPNSIKPIHVQHPYTMELFPNPASTSFTIKFNVNNIVNARYFISNTSGALLQSNPIEITQAGEVKYLVTLDKSYLLQNLIVTLVIDNTYYLSKSLVLE